MSIRDKHLWEPANLPAPLDLGQGRMAVRLVLRTQGRDLLLQVQGGEAHVGAVAVAEPGGGEAALTVVPGHKEGPLARAAAETLARKAGCVCTVVAGIHQDGATKAEIREIVANVTAGVDRLAEILREVRS